MTTTYTPGSGAALDQVRLRIPDTDVAEHPIFSDEEILDFVALEGGDVRYATAAALDTIASQQALLLKVVRQLDTTTDGAKLGAELRARAKSLREESDKDGAFAIAEMVHGPFGARQRWGNQLQRRWGP